MALSENSTIAYQPAVRSDNTAEAGSMQESPRPAIPALQSATVNTTTVQTPSGMGRATTVHAVAQTTTGFLQDDQGHQSSLRIMAMLALGASIVIALIAMLDQRAAASANGLYLTGMFLTAAFTGKVAQKFAEGKTPTQE